MPSVLGPADPAGLFPPRPVPAPSRLRLRMCGGHSCAPWQRLKLTCCATSRCCFLRTGRKPCMRDSFRLRYPAGSFSRARACHPRRSLSRPRWRTRASLAETRAEALRLRGRCGRGGRLRGAWRAPVGGVAGRLAGGWPEVDGGVQLCRSEQQEGQFPGGAPPRFCYCTHRVLKFTEHSGFNIK